MTARHRGKYSNRTMRSLDAADHDSGAGAPHPQHQDPGIKSFHELCHVHRDRWLGHEKDIRQMQRKSMKLPQAQMTHVSMGFSRQEYLSRLPCPSPAGLPNPGIKPMSPAPPALAGRFFSTSAPWEVEPTTRITPGIITVEKGRQKVVVYGGPHQGARARVRAGLGLTYA